MALRSKTYVIRDGKAILLEEAEPRSEMHYIIGDDIPPLLNHADGQVYTSKSEFRKATIRAGCREIGNDKIEPSQPSGIDRQKRRDTIGQIIAEYHLVNKI